MLRRSAVWVVVAAGLCGWWAPADAQNRAKRAKPEESAAPATGPIESATFSVSVEDVVGKPLAARVRLLDGAYTLSGRFDVPNGSGSFQHARGQYTALVEVYDGAVPILVHVAALTLSAAQPAELKVSVLEGSGTRSLAEFDRDLDLALDSLEVQHGRDPQNARSTPGEPVLTWPSPVLSEKGGWYRGELHAYSSHGTGTESVERVIRRAEAAGLDFLAIADPNTLAAANDPAFKSSKLVLIPAMEWGTPETGTAIVLAPDTLLPIGVSRAEAQALAVRLQARGGLFIISRPAAPGSAWNWGLNYFNGVEVWWRDWRGLPPIQLANLSEEWRMRDQGGALMFPIAVAAATQGLSGNAQGTIFYDIATTHGLKAAVIAGTSSTGRKETLGSPATYVFAREKSLNGILEGIRKGRTYVSRSSGGPMLEFQADIMADGKVDVGMGGVIPINVKSRFVVGVSGAKGAQLQLLMNGYPIWSRMLETDKETWNIDDTPNAMGAIRVRVVTAPDKFDGYGFSELLAMSSPIYAQSYFVEGGPDAGRDGWVDVTSTYQEIRPEDEFDPAKLDPSRVVTLTPRN